MNKHSIFIMSLLMIDSCIPQSLFAQQRASDYHPPSDCTPIIDTFVCWEDSVRPAFPAGCIVFNYSFSANNRWGQTIFSSTDARQAWYIEAVPLGQSQLEYVLTYQIAGDPTIYRKMAPLIMTNWYRYCG